MRLLHLVRDDESGEFAREGDETVGHETRVALNPDEKNILDLLALMLTTDDEDSVDGYFSNMVVRLSELRGNKIREITESQHNAMFTHGA